MQERELFNPPYVRADREEDQADTDHALGVLSQPIMIHNALFRNPDVGLRERRTHAASMIVLMQAAVSLMLIDAEFYKRPILITNTMRDRWIEVYRKLGGMASESGSSVDLLQVLKES